MIGLLLIVLMVLENSLVRMFVVCMVSVMILVRGFSLIVVMKIRVMINLLIDWKIFIRCCIGWMI